MAGAVVAIVEAMLELPSWGKQSDMDLFASSVGTSEFSSQIMKVVVTTMLVKVQAGHCGIGTRAMVLIPNG